MKSPEIEIQVKEVEKLITETKYEVIIAPNNCVPPEPAIRENILTASGLILYLREEYEFKYKECLNSLGR